MKPQQPGGVPSFCKVAETIYCQYSRPGPLIYAELSSRRFIYVVESDLPPGPRTSTPLMEESYISRFPGYSLHLPFFAHDASQEKSLKCRVRPRGTNGGLLLVGVHTKTVSS